VDPGLGCTPFTAPNTTNPNASASQALNELGAGRIEGHGRAVPGQRPQPLVGQLQHRQD
jgi:hypothetical protein